LVPLSLIRRGEIEIEGLAPLLNILMRNNVFNVRGQYHKIAIFPRPSGKTSIVKTSIM
jgi:hypothetical protein